MPTILVVDDDANIRELVKLNLEQVGFDVLEAAHGEEALFIFETAHVDMAVIDAMMPRLDGWGLCREIRTVSTIPLLMLTAMGETTDKIRGFKLGVDDYLVKPFDPQELVARIKAILKRYRINMEQTVQIGHLQLDRNTYSGMLHGQETALPPKEFELLFKLASFPGRTLTREQLIEDIWGYDYEGDERTVDVHIKRLRERFPEHRCAFRIATIRGLGYRLEVSQ